MDNENLEWQLLGGLFDGVFLKGSVGPKFPSQIYWDLCWKNKKELYLSKWRRELWWNCTVHLVMKIVKLETVVFVFDVRNGILKLDLGHEYKLELFLNFVSDLKWKQLFLCFQILEFYGLV